MPEDRIDPLISTDDRVPEECECCGQFRLMIYREDTDGNAFLICDECADGTDPLFSRDELLQLADEVNGSDLDLWIDRQIERAERGTDDDDDDAE